jgi:hypothetical protein
VTPVNQPAPEDSEDYAALEAERERFLREFRSQNLRRELPISVATSLCCSKE